MLLPLLFPYLLHFTIEETAEADLRLFCFIPFFKIKKRNENDTRVYLFNFIPILRFRKTNKYEYINLFDFIPLIRGNR